MTEFLSFDLNQAYNEIKENAEAQGIADQEAWDTIVEEYLEDKVSVGELDKDEEIEEFEEVLKAKWSEYEKNINIH